MIHVDRSRVAKPKILTSIRAEKERVRAKEWFHAPDRDRQRRYDEFYVYRASEVVATLQELFHGKCAYCEIRIPTWSEANVELYRPKGGVTESPEHPGYWWLASDWDNLLASCLDCNSGETTEGSRTGKGNRFPLAVEANRAFDEGEEQGESPLLLNPCRDDPAPALLFDGGQVYSGDDRGQATISVLNLNRPHLVAARAKVAAHVLDLTRALASLIDGYVSGRDSPISSVSARQRQMRELATLTDDTAEFAGLARQIATPTFERLVEVRFLRNRPPWMATTKAVSPAAERATKQAFHRYETDQSSFTLASDEGRRAFTRARRLVERVTIHNVKAIERLDLDLTEVGSGRTPWLMLLGENGTGKSTLLQSIAMTLIGGEAFIRLASLAGLDPREYIRYGRKSGTVAVKLSGFVGPHKLTFREDRVEFTSPTGERESILFDTGTPRREGSGWEPQTVVLGYGATRLLPRDLSPSVTSTGDTYSRVDNLFNPFVPLRDADTWMAGLNPLQFNTATVVLKDLCRLAARSRFELDENRRVIVVNNGSRVTLRQLSDGYQSVVATAVDILDVMTSVWDNLLEAEGIVVLDEIGAHLHPTWKMRIVESIRRAAPGIQFITSTHDPLCLRGLGAGEVVVLRRDARRRIRSVTGLPSPADFRVDQLLASDFFGLDSTVDPEIEVLFDTYYALLALPRRSAAQERRLANLQAQLASREYFGVTPREQLMYAAIDKILADQRADPIRPVVELKPAAIEAVSRIWAQNPTPIG